MHRHDMQLVLVLYKLWSTSTDDATPQVSFTIWNSSVASHLTKQ